MIPIEFPERNDELPAIGSPSGRMPVHRNGTATISVWALTPEEMMEIQATGVIYLVVGGQNMPPSMTITGHRPFDPAVN